MKLRIFHTNDIHSNFDFLKKVHGYLRKNRTAQDFYFDSGDFTDLRNVMVQADKGISATELLIACGLDGMPLGNNEVDMGRTAVLDLAAAGVPVIVANVTDAEDGELPGIPASRIYERAGKRFLVIGLGPYYREYGRPSGYNVFAEMGNLKFQAPEEYVRRELNKNLGKYDFCILLSHSGCSTEFEIMRQFPEINLCLGGHSHEVDCHRGYTQSGMGEYLGVVTLEIDAFGVREVNSELIELTEVLDEEFDGLLAEKEAFADKVLSQELPVVDELSFDPFSECPLINFVCDCMYKHFGGDMAIMHNGIAEEALTRPVSRKSLLLNFPSKLNPTIYSIKGEKILEAIRLSFDEEYIRADGRGPGFRGKVLGTLGYSNNVQVVRKPFAVYVDGKELLPEKEYTIVTDDYLQRGTGYPSLKVPNDICSYDKWFIRDMVENYLTVREVFESALIRRCR